MRKTVIGIFDDDKVDRFVYGKMFQGMEDRIEVHVFDNPDKGIEIARQIPFDVVFIDIHFWENFGGIGILNKLKKTLTKDIISVAMSSLLQEGDLETIIGAGFTMCLEKPIPFQTILPLDNYINEREA